MPTTYDDVFRIALSLPPGSRAMLAEHLLKSLEAEDVAQIDTLWSEEAEKRWQQIANHQISTVPFQQVLQKLELREQ